MKRFILITLLFISGMLYSQELDTSLNWLTNIEKAKKISKELNKPILVYFTGSDWCTPCIKLKEDFFNSKEFLEKQDKMVLVMIDMPRRIDIISEKQKEYNKKVLSKYNSKKIFPKMIFLNSKGKVLDEFSGYSYYGDTSNHFRFINEQIKNYN